MIENLRKSKILVSMVAIILMIALLGNVYSLATEGNSNTVTITAVTPQNTASTENTTSTENTLTNGTETNTVSITATTNTSTNTNSVVSNISTVSASVNNTTNNTVNNTTNNSSNYTNTNTVTTSTKLPHTGTSSKTVLLAVVFAISAVYAYKKVTDYNV